MHIEQLEVLSYGFLRLSEHSSISIEFFSCPAWYDHQLGHMQPLSFLYPSSGTVLLTCIRIRLLSRPIGSCPLSCGQCHELFFFYLSIFIQDNSTQHSQRLELKLRPDAFLHDRLQA